MDTIKLAVASEIRGRVTGDSRNAILANIQEQDSDRAATKRATHALANLAKNEEVVNVIVEGGVIPTLVQHLQALSVTEEDLVQKLLPFEHEVEKGSALHFDFLPSRSMADIVINHRVGTTQGRGGIYNRFDGIPLSWDERAVTLDTGGLGSTGILATRGSSLDYNQEAVKGEFWRLRDDQGKPSSVMGWSLVLWLSCCGLEKRFYAHRVCLVK
ncbi:ARM REPEAT PROTEIN INTERACTING WITH [Arachis hypogaea]|nr:ARM REPEAT PROTEIN INTERACTING WITH [Arachis hypogaea]